jgi:integration host factor subunit alpha
MTLTKAELVDHLVTANSLDRPIAKDIVEDFFEFIRETLERGEEVKLSGFGNFKVRKKRSRPGRNPKTGEEIEISARRVVTFHSGHKLKARVKREARVHHDG